MKTNDRQLRDTVLIVALLNCAYFGVEFASALMIGSVSLLGDSADFLEDAAVNILIFSAIGWSASRRAKLGMLLAALLLLPAIAFLWTLWGKAQAPAAPAAVPLTVVGLGALGVNLACAFLLSRFRAHGGSLAKAAFLSARNDAFANIGIILAGLVTMPTRSMWPDIVVGLLIAAMNIGAAREVFEAAHADHRAAKPAA